MRYEKGSIAISTGQDLPLLRQVLESQFITHDQLFEFMRHGCYELKRSSFNWRVLRLVQKGFLERHALRASSVYSIADAGASFLAVTEDYCPVLSRRRHKDASSYDHALELNELHLGLIRQGILEEWKPEIVIRSRNELTADGYTKDYDAIVTVNVDGKVASLALEYERTPKKPSEYSRIRRLIEREDRLGIFLYIAPNSDLAGFVLNCFLGTTAPLSVGLAANFTHSLKDMRVADARAGQVCSLMAIL